MKRTTSRSSVPEPPVRVSCPDCRAVRTVAAVTARRVAAKYGVGGVPCWACSRVRRRGKRGASYPDPPPAPTAPAPWPTRHRPGTREKILVLAWRYANGFELYHPGDSR